MIWTPSVLAFSLAAHSEARSAKRAPLSGAHLERLALAGPELEHLGHRLAVGLEAGLLLPGLEKARGNGVERIVDGQALLLVAGGVLGGQGGEPLALEPARRRPGTPRRTARRAGVR